MDFWRSYPIIDDATSEGDIMGLFSLENRPQEFSKGYEERDYSLYPEEMFDAPNEMELIPESEYDARIDEQEVTKSSLEHLYLGADLNSPAFVNLDQNGDGYCWFYSTGHAAMFLRLRDHQPTIRLNPHSGAAIIKKGRNEGGWCGLSGQFATEVGIAVEGNGPGQWPLQSRDLRYDTPECRAQMALNKLTEGWWDLTRQVYDRNLTERQHCTALLTNTPTPSDFNWWGHSVCAIRLVKIEAGSYGKLIINSWKGWGRHGLAVLRGSKMYPNGAIAPRVIRAHPPTLVRGAA